MSQIKVYFHLRPSLNHGRTVPIYIMLLVTQITTCMLNLCSFATIYFLLQFTTQVECLCTSSSRWYPKDQVNMTLPPKKKTRDGDGKRRRKNQVRNGLVVTNSSSPQPQWTITVGLPALHWQFCSRVKYQNFHVMWIVVVVCSSMLMVKCLPHMWYMPA